MFAQSRKPNRVSHTCTRSHVHRARSSYCLKCPKAKRVYVDTVIIDADEHRTLANLETYYNMSAWFACFPPNEPHVCHLILNRSLAALPVTGRKGKPLIVVPLQMARLADERRDFMAAVLGAIGLR